MKVCGEATNHLQLTTHPLAKGHCGVLDCILRIYYKTNNNNTTELFRVIDLGDVEALRTWLRMLLSLL